MNRTLGPHRLLQDRSSTLNNKFPMAKIQKKGMLKLLTNGSIL